MVFKRTNLYSMLELVNIYMYIYILPFLFSLCQSKIWMIQEWLCRTYGWLSFFASLVTANFQTPGRPILEGWISTIMYYTPMYTYMGSPLMTEMQFWKEESQYWQGNTWCVGTEWLFSQPLARCWPHSIAFQDTASRFVSPGRLCREQMWNAKPNECVSFAHLSL